MDLTPVKVCCAIINLLLLPISLSESKYSWMSCFAQLIATAVCISV